MAYSRGGKIEKGDYNDNIVGSTTSTSSTNINTIWAVGSSKAGYGQTAISNVSQFGKVSGDDWVGLIGTINKIRSHTNTAGSAYDTTKFQTGQPVTYVPSVTTDISSLYTNKNNAVAQAGTVTADTVTVTNSTTWLDYLTFTHTITFANGNAARYFFNAGGQLALTFSHPTGSGANAYFNALATALGTIVISSPNTGTVTIAGTDYNGVTKIGGSGINSATTTNWQNYGYYGLTTTYTEVYRQTGSGLTGFGGVSYNSSYISISVKTSAVQGSNADNGATITIQVTFDEVPNGLINSANTSVALTVRRPSTTYLTNTWGTVNAVTGTNISVSGSVTGA